MGYRPHNHLKVSELTCQKRVCISLIIGLVKKTEDADDKAVEQGKEPIYPVCILLAAVQLDARSEDQRTVSANSAQAKFCISDCGQKSSGRRPH